MAPPTPVVEAPQAWPAGAPVGFLPKSSSLSGCAVQELVRTLPSAQAAPPQQQPEEGITSMEGLVKRLHALFDAEKKKAAAGQYTIGKDQPPELTAQLDAAVRELMKEYSGSGAQDWRSYAYFNDIHYVRNLVEGTEEFELIVLCWRAGQGSRVHAHANSHCWLTVLQGPMQEVQYTSPDYAAWNLTRPFAVQAGEQPAEDEVPAGHTVVQHTETTTLSAGQTAYINDNLALHAVRCPEGNHGHEGGVSLHLYSPPIRRVRLLEPDSDHPSHAAACGRVVERTPGFFTVGGQKPGPQH